ncbi:nucleic acid/nucleotide deaminase domain-containing protein [Streptomyces sp. NPDC004609]|uniref:WXG100-like domain-containing protein n=1 Tax=Streptomyces sp. NPDC004609 TaxID=3364704 RepID=UPI0036ADFC86
MGVQLPEEVREILEFIGYDWPDIDEDQLRDTAREYREFAGELRTTIERANKACATVTDGKSRGHAVDAFRTRWGKVSGQDMKNLADAVDVLAGALDSGAGFVEVCKYAIIADVTASAVAIGAGIVGAFFTFGASTVLSAAAVAALKVLVREALDLLVQQLIDLAVKEIEGRLLKMLEGLFDDAVTSGGKDAQGKDLPQGPDGVGQVLWTEFVEFEDAMAELRREQGRLQEQKNGFDGRRTKRSLVAKKDSRFAKFGEAVDKAEDKIDETAVKMTKEIEKNADGLDRTKRDNDRDDKKAKDDIDGCQPGKKKDDGDDTPVYILNLDGSVDKLLPNGTIDRAGLNADDRANLSGIMENGKVWRPPGRKDQQKWNTPKGHSGTVRSTKVDPATDELGRATQNARKAHDYYQGANYAAGRYVDPDTGRTSILVGRSDGSYHSEKIIGHPILQKGKESGLQELFTEREPCQKSPRCNRWLDSYFPETNVTHAVRYDQSDKATQNKEHTEYVNALKASPRR